MMMMTMMKRPKTAASIVTAAETMAVTMTAVAMTAMPARLHRSNAAESLAPTGGRL
jgi:hypothetical protein